MMLAMRFFGQEASVSPQQVLKALYIGRRDLCPLRTPTINFAADRQVHLSLVPSQIAVCIELLTLRLCSFTSYPQKPSCRPSCSVEFKRCAIPLPLFL